MKPASRTPEGFPYRCPVCDKVVRIDFSSFPTPDAPCPHCGHLLWLVHGEDASDEDATDEAIERLKARLLKLELKREAFLEVEFKEFLTTCLEELVLINTGNQQWGLGEYEAWELDQESAKLVFSNANGRMAVTTAQIIGTLNAADNSWLWAWSNPSIADALKLHARQLLNYGQQQQIPRLISPSWEGTNEDGWAMAALAVKLCGAEGAYRGQADDLHVYMTFSEVEVSRS